MQRFITIVPCKGAVYTEIVGNGTPTIGGNMKKHKKPWYEMQDPDATSRHHRVCKSKGGNGLKHNQIVVRKICHVAWHVLYANLEPHQIAEVMNHWISPKLKFIVIRRE